MSEEISEDKASRTDEEEQDEVEAHSRRHGANEEPAPEGEGKADDDFEAHRRNPA